ncbi:hypothetical protein V6N13_136612 [Hibiscus sabdariffa]|uniref:Uncharacterized protein n=1 Tax=Hibiscus sabdariffa TaxID=183260 RepID=A0ABR2DN41_9ROSI
MPISGIDIAFDRDVVIPALLSCLRLARNNGGHLEWDVCYAITWDSVRKPGCHDGGRLPPEATTAEDCVPMLLKRS